MTATKIQPGDDLHLTSLMARHSLNLVTGADRAALLAYGRDVFAAARDSKCLAQIEEPAQPIAGYRISDPSDPTIKPWLSETPDDNGYKSEPLYARAAPAAVAGPADERTAVLDAARDLIELRDEYAQKTQNAMPGNEYWSERFDAKYQALAAALAAAPALEAPAAPARIVADALIRLDAIYREEADCDEPPKRPDWLVNALHLAAAAPQAPAAPTWDQLREMAVKHGAWVSGYGPFATELLATYGRAPEDQPHWVAQWMNAVRAMRAAPAAPAVDAWLQPDDMAALQRFHETAEDDESYDIGKEAVARLCAFGCLQSHSFGRYSTTDFGDYLLDTWAGARTLPFTTAAEREALAAQAAAKGAA